MRKSGERACRGASGLTYGILVGLVSVVAITAVVNSGSGINRLFGRVSNELQGIRLATPAPSGTPGDLYSFTTHSFTNCGTSGRNGPSLASCRSAYSTSGNWDENNAYFNQGSFAGYQLWTVPQTGIYQIEAAGGRGGYGDGGTSSSYWGSGRIMTGTVSLTRGEQLTIVVGHQAEDSHRFNGYKGAAGGGASWVMRGADAASATPLVIAGGGGGSNAVEVYGYSGVGNNNDTYFGRHGRSDHSGDVSRSAGGSGYLGNGASLSQTGQTVYGGSQDASSFRAGAVGGHNSSCGYNGSQGGFGGGGSPHCHSGGGGGGYTGGAGGNGPSWSGEGGGSFFGTGVTSVSTSGLNAGQGYVTITRQ